MTEISTSTSQHMIKMIPLFDHFSAGQCCQHYPALLNAGCDSISINKKPPNILLTCHDEGILRDIFQEVSYLSILKQHTVDEYCQKSRNTKVKRKNETGQDGHLYPLSSGILWETLQISAAEINTVCMPVGISII